LFLAWTDLGLVLALFKPMGQRLKNKHSKTARNKARAYAEGKAPAKHKIDAARSRKAKLKKANPMT
jgi:hypothetical protein